MPRWRWKPFEFKGHLKEASSLGYMRPLVVDSSRSLHTHEMAWVSQVPCMGMAAWLMAGAVQVRSKLVAVAALGQLWP